ncbi:MAG: hypothetical protein Q4C22_08075, partial [Bacillota bacterium]|nr:hypothetical protein [Bacillota bacterium]
PEAQAQADELVQSASVAQSEAVIRATAEAAEFDGLYQQYLENPGSVMDGIFRERVSQVLLQMGATVVVPEEGQPPRIILP